jgi:hypothetical protein
VTYRDVDTILTTPIHKSDIWNFNEYDATNFLAFFYVDGVVADDADFSLWKVLTRNGGNR